VVTAFLVVWSLVCPQMPHAVASVGRRRCSSPAGACRLSLA